MPSPDAETAIPAAKAIVRTICDVHNPDDSTMLMVAAMIVVISARRTKSRSREEYLGFVRETAELLAPEADEP
jgi:hypothetical protein